LRAAGVDVEEEVEEGMGDDCDEDEEEKPAKLSTARRMSSTPTKPRQRAFDDEEGEHSITGAERMSREAKRRRT
jgi:hypothetical protein